MILGSVIDGKQPLRDQLQRDVDAFLARGGKKQLFKPGESGVDHSKPQAHRTRKQRKEQP